MKKQILILMLTLTTASTLATNYTDKLLKYYTEPESQVLNLAFCYAYYTGKGVYNGSETWKSKFKHKYLSELKSIAKKHDIDWEALDKNKSLTMLRAGIILSEVQTRNFCNELGDTYDVEYDNPKGE